MSKILGALLTISSQTTGMESERLPGQCWGFADTSIV